MVGGGICGALASSVWLLAACQKTEPVAQSAPASQSAPSIAHSAVVQPPPAETMPEVSVVCAGFAKTAPPAADLPAQSELAGLAVCDADAAYFGLDTAVDFARARKCSFGDPRVGAPGKVARADVLMMIYANGSGVPVNLDLALHFACELGGAGLELGGRVTRLWEARQRGKLEGVLDVCDDATSGDMTGACAARSERADEAQRKLRRAAAIVGMPAREVQALLRAAHFYVEASSAKEVDTSGSLRESFMVAAQDHLEADFVDALERARDPGFVPATVDAKALEKQLSEWATRIASCKIMAKSERLVPGLITRAGIRETQQRWLAYRAAFVALAMKVKPQSPADAWRAWLTEPRLKQLQELGEGC